MTASPELAPAVSSDAAMPIWNADGGREEVDITEELKTFLVDQPDPHVAAAAVLPRVSEAQRDELALKGLELRARRLAHELRREVEPEDSDTSRGTRGASWAEQHHIVIEGLGDRIYIEAEGAWVFIESCTVPQLQDYRKEQLKRARQIVLVTRKVDALIKQMQDAGASTVRELYQAGSRAAA